MRHSGGSADTCRNEIKLSKSKFGVGATQVSQGCHLRLPAAIGHKVTHLELPATTSDLGKVSVWPLLLLTDINPVKPLVGKKGLTAPSETTCCRV